MPPRKRSLRVATEDDAPKAAKSLTDATADGDSRAMLVAMREIVAARVQDKNTSPRDLAALTRRLIEINNDIQAIDAAAGEGNIGEAAATPDEAFNSEAL